MWLAMTAPKPSPRDAPFKADKSNMQQIGKQSRCQYMAEPWTRTKQLNALLASASSPSATSAAPSGRLPTAGGQPPPVPAHRKTSSEPDPRPMNNNTTPSFQPVTAASSRSEQRRSLPSMSASQADGRPWLITGALQRTDHAYRRPFKKKNSGGSDPAARMSHSGFEHHLENRQPLQPPPRSASAIALDGGLSSPIPIEQRLVLSKAGASHDHRPPSPSETAFRGGLRYGPRHSGSSGDVDASSSAPARSISASSVEIRLIPEEEDGVVGEATRVVGSSTSSGLSLQSPGEVFNVPAVNIIPATLTRLAKLPVFDDEVGSLSSSEDVPSYERGESDSMTSALSDPLNMARGAIGRRSFHRIKTFKMQGGFSNSSTSDHNEDERDSPCVDGAIDLQDDTLTCATIEPFEDLSEAAATLVKTMDDSQTVVELYSLQKAPTPMSTSRADHSSLSRWRPRMLASEKESRDSPPLMDSDNFDEEEEDVFRGLPFSNSLDRNRQAPLHSTVPGRHSLSPTSTLPSPGLNFGSSADGPRVMSARKRSLLVMPRADSLPANAALPSMPTLAIGGVVLVPGRTSDTESTRRSWHSDHSFSMSVSSLESVDGPIQQKASAMKLFPTPSSLLPPTSLSDDERGRSPHPYNHKSLEHSQTHLYSGGASGAGLLAMPTVTKPASPFHGRKMLPPLDPARESPVSTGRRKADWDKEVAYAAMGFQSQNLAILDHGRRHSDQVTPTTGEKQKRIRRPSETLPTQGTVDEAHTSFASPLSRSKSLQEVDKAEVLKKHPPKKFEHRDSLLPGHERPGDRTPKRHGPFRLFRRQSKLKDLVAEQTESVLSQVHLPRRCRHELAVFVNSSMFMNWYHVVPCFDSSPIDEDTRLPTITSHHHHHHYVMQRNNHECNTAPECGVFSYCSDSERRIRQAIWELFRSECTYFIDSLLVLEEVYKPTMKVLKSHDLMEEIDLDRVFGNLHELCQSSGQLCKRILTLFNSHGPGRMGNMEDVARVFENFAWRVHSPYSEYASNFYKSTGYIDSLLLRTDFTVYEKFCKKHPRVRKRTLKDFLIEPVTHLPHFILVLKDIEKSIMKDTSHQRSADLGLLHSTIMAISLSCRQTESKFQEFEMAGIASELNSAIVWPKFHQLDPQAVIPDGVGPGTPGTWPSVSPLELEYSDSRFLKHYGTLKLYERIPTNGNQRRLVTIIASVFLFNDMLLVTKPVSKTKQRTDSQIITMLSEGTTRGLSPDQFDYYLHRQPCPVDRVAVYDVPSTSMYHHAFCIVQFNRFMQVIRGFTLDAADQKTKDKWMSMINETKGRFD